jgi:hypothetical protein
MESTMTFYYINGKLGSKKVFLPLILFNVVASNSSDTDTDSETIIDDVVDNNVEWIHNLAENREYLRRIHAINDALDALESDRLAYSNYLDSFENDPVAFKKNYVSIKDALATIQQRFKLIKSEYETLKADRYNKTITSNWKSWIIRIKHTKSDHSKDK